MTVDEAIAVGLCGLCEGSGLMAAVGFSSVLVLPCDLCAGTGKDNVQQREQEELNCRERLREKFPVMRITKRKF